MTPEDFVQRLNNVKSTGPGRWLAKCPAHDDKHPSFNVATGDDGKILFICRSGCEQPAVLAALGLKWGDLYPESLNRIPFNEFRKSFPAADVLEALTDEAMLVAVAASNVAAGVKLTEEDLKRVWLAYTRIENARRLTLGQRK
jgi:hypothetical protein